MTTRDIVVAGALPRHLTLGELIDALKAADPAKRVPLGFGNPHSYRGYYDELAFEPTTDTTVGEMLAAAESAVGTTYEGWKGGDFTMDTYTQVWLSLEGRSSGETLGSLLLSLMLTATEAQWGQIQEWVRKLTK